jgi:KipI family sensor histidine kinase inhibitor
MEPGPTITPLGDSALQIAVGPDFDRHTQFLAALQAINAPAIRDIVGGHSTIVVHLDPLNAHLAELETLLAAALRQPASVTTAASRLIDIEVCYDHEMAPDLADVATACGRSVDEVIARHLAPTYRVELVGFLPGFGYLTGLDPALTLPRRSTPRTLVPAQSVAIAAQYTGVYPSESPGGWHLIGRAATAMLTLESTARPTLLERGDRVRFHRVTRDQLTHASA